MVATSCSTGDDVIQGAVTAIFFSHENEEKYRSCPWMLLTPDTVAARYTCRVKHRTTHKILIFIFLVTRRTYPSDIDYKWYRTTILKPSYVPIP